MRVQRIHEAFHRAHHDLKADVLLWGKTQNPHIEIVLLRFERQHNGWVVYCFNNQDGGFYNPQECNSYGDAVAAFNDVLTRLGAYEA